MNTNLAARRSCLSPLAQAASTFNLLTAGPSPLSLPRVVLDAGASRSTPSVPLHRLRHLLDTHPGGQRLRHAVWVAIVDRARAGDPQWRVAAVHLASARIARTAASRAACTGQPEVGVEAEVITDLLRSIDDGTATGLDWLA